MLALKRTQLVSAAGPVIPHEEGGSASVSVAARSFPHKSTPLYLNIPHYGNPASTEDNLTSLCGGNPHPS